MKRTGYIFVFIALLSFGFSIPLAARALFQPRATAGETDTLASDSPAKGISYYYKFPKHYFMFSTGEIRAGFENCGRFGDGLIYYDDYPSYETPEGSHIEYLWTGAIWVGGVVNGDTLVSVGVDGWFMGEEFFPVVTGYESDNYSGGRSIWTLFTDTITDPHFTGTDPNESRPHVPLNLRIANRAYAWPGEPNDGVIVYDMVMTNMGDQPIQQGYVGLYFDNDVCHISYEATGYDDDLTGSLRQSGLAYAIDNDGDPVSGQFIGTSPTKTMAFKFLQTSFNAVDTSYNWWIPNYNLEYDFGPMPVDEYGNLQCSFNGHFGFPQGDGGKYCMMSHAGWDYDQIFTDTIPGWAPPTNADYAHNLAHGYDTRFLMSIGPFDLLPDSSLRVLFTTVTGESVHQVPDNLANLPDNPAQYLANLNFSDVIANAAVADLLGATLVDPNLPVTGLYVQYDSIDSTVVEWDPYGFPGVEGYNLYLYEVPEDDMPYPGVLPPWITPPISTPTAQVGQIYRYPFSSLQPHHFYLVCAANRLPSDEGAMCDPVAFQAGGRPPAPIIDNEFIFIEQAKGYPITLTWGEPAGIHVDHYNIYKFADPQAAKAKYYPRYDTGQFLDSAVAADSFLIGGQQYYYYAMTPYAQVDSGLSEFSEITDDSVVYVVTAVDTAGMESSFSKGITILVVPPATKDMVVVTFSRRGNGNYMIRDSVIAFYNRVLQGFDYDFYMFYDSSRVHFDSLGRYTIDPLWWYYLLNYELVIFDDGLQEGPPQEWYPEAQGESVTGITKCILSGRKVAYFGSFRRLLNFSLNNWEPEYIPMDHPFTGRFFGTDSLFRMRIEEYGPVEYGTRDTLVGMIGVDGSNSVIPDIGYDSLRNAYHASMDIIWPTGTAVAPSVFVVNQKGRTIQRLQSKYPETSLVNWLPAGVKTETEGGTTYLFGYHLWYMEETGARELIDYMMNDVAPVSVAATLPIPDTLFAFYANALDTIPGTICVAYDNDVYNMDDIDVSTVRINETLTTRLSGPIVNPGNIDGEALQLTIDLRPFVAGYGVAWDTTVQAYTVTGALTDGTPLALQGNFILVGHISGDANGDQTVTIGDAVFVVNYVFRDGPAPSLEAAADANADGKVDLGDAVCLVNFIFRGGARPQHP